LSNESREGADSESAIIVAGWRGPAESSYPYVSNMKWNFDSTIGCLRECRGSTVPALINIDISREASSNKKLFISKKGQAISLNGNSLVPNSKGAWEVGSIKYREGSLQILNPAMSIGKRSGGHELVQLYVWVSRK